ncbi:DUF4178 domain-containing protein [Burkholderia stagnalis]|uniref:DUF4178 domain-containing protein n=1 Tax=Burkholderia stagnalis TaxID=1503054 RepID=UPI0007536E18|nr:DUF4178 domain-containing protein [Burkholderia stagnalis]KVN05984.1 hypothetical protein WT07_05195 [Burkholderia stagnalis]KWD99578.1 hypothetical protein WT47_24390 [Burkholderia stagnalis]KWE15525.1 hypothetical protein WT48_16050 [Burkholderia stagnalis]KWO84954.1 hypothetical protein WU00_28600 [Burkholderia stagnalis]
MFSTSCPQCGAPVTFRSAAAVMAVCAFCRSTLLKRGEDVERIGELAAVLDDASPLQIGTAGRYGKLAFTVLGRLQMSYDAGGWSEWYVVFDDGTFGWLSDASGQYAVTVRQPDDALGSWPAFQALQPGVQVAFGGQDYLVSDLRTARCTGGDGELPFRVGEGWQARVADLRTGNAFATFDYSDAGAGGKPVVYAGEAMTFDALAFTGLRDIETESREPRGAEMKPFACPSCGAPLSYAPNVADYVVCGSCHAGVQCTADQQTVFAKQRELDAVKGALELGAAGTFDGAKYTVIGMMRCKVPGDNETWDEYLLLHPKRGVLWLVQSEGRWERVGVLDHWPTIHGDAEVIDDGKTYRKRDAYGSEVVYVVGAFNWRVQVGDRTSIVDYGWQNDKLTMERSANEIVWSRAQRISAGKLAERFGVPALAAGGAAATAAATLAGVEAKDKRPHSFAPLPVLFSALLVFLNFEALFAFNSRTVYVLIGLLVLWLPEWVWKGFAQDGGES